MLPLLLFLFPLVSSTFRDQSIGAKGFVSCRGIRQPGVFVQLYDEDTMTFFDSDDLMGSTTADGFGGFCVRGTTSEVSDIDPYILIEHNCGYEGLDQKTTFFYYLNTEHIVEGNISTSIEHLGEIELLTEDAPVQTYSRRHHNHRHLHRTQQARINECLPLYVTYKDFYEKEVFGTGESSPVKILEADVIEEASDGDSIDKEILETIQTGIDKMEHQESESLLKIEEEAKRLADETIRLEEERIRIEKIRIEEERQREEEKRREDERKAEEERRREAEKNREEERAAREGEPERKHCTHLHEEERRKEEERSRLEYEQRMEDYRKREEERLKEIARREEMSRKIIKVETSSSAERADAYDPCAHRIKRHGKMDYSDPCYRKLRG